VRDLDGFVTSGAEIQIVRGNNASVSVRGSRAGRKLKNSNTLRETAIHHGRARDNLAEEERRSWAGTERK